MVLASTAITSTGAELNILDGSTSATGTTIANSDRVVLNDNGAMVQVAVTDIDTYVSATSKTLTNKTLTAPKIADGGFIADANGNELVVFQTTGSAVNELDIANAATGGAVTLSTTGGDSNIDLTLNPKGTGEVNIAAGNLNYAGTAVTATGAELNIVDGGTSATGTTIDDADRVVFNDDGTMKQVAVTDLAAYFDDEITTMPNLVTTAATTVGALNSGSITSGFGAIDNGSSNITTTGVGTFASLDISGNIDVDGITNLDAVDIDSNVQLDGTFTVGTDGSGQDVILYSGTSGDNFTWDASEEILIITGTNGQTALNVADGNLVVADNIDLEGDIDVDGTTNLDAVDIDGAIDIAGASTFNGAVTLGDGTGDDITNTGRWVNAFVPKVDAAVDLGTTALGFNDFHLGSGGIINLDGGDVTLTHAAGKVTLGGDGAVEIDFNNHEMTNVDVNSGAIDGTTIGAASASTGAFTTLAASGVTTFSDKIIINSSAEDGGNGVAIPLTNHATFIQTGGAETSTLGAGTEGQIKVIVMETDNGDMVTTVTNAAWGGSSIITFDAVGDGVTLQYIDSKWYCIGNNGAVIG